MFWLYFCHFVNLKTFFQEIFGVYVLSSHLHSCRGSRLEQTFGIYFFTNIARQCMNNRKSQTALWEWKILNQEYWSWPRQYECSLNPAHLNSTVLHPTVLLNYWSVAGHLERYVIQTGMHFTFLFRYWRHDVLAAPWRCRYGVAATLRWHILQGGQFDKPRICHTVLQDPRGRCPDHHILFCWWEVSQSDRTILQVSICRFISTLYPNK